MQKSTLIEELRSVYQVHFTFDLWSSPNHLSFLELTGHWITSNGDISHALLGLKELHGGHTGDNQFQIVFSLLKEYLLLDKIEYFTLDNARNNDKALSLLSSLHQGEGIKFDDTESRLRCLGHMINLVVKVFLYGSDVEADTNIADDESGATQAQMIQWRKRGPYGRLRNIITYICWTPQRREEFTNIAKEYAPNDPAFQPIAVNLTRWNSDFRAIKRALHLRDSFELFTARHLRDGLQDDQLSPEDWIEL